MPRARTASRLCGQVFWLAYHSPRESNRKTAISASPCLIARPPSRGKSLTDPTRTHRGPDSCSCDPFGPLGRRPQPDLLERDEVGRPAGGVLLAPLRHELHARGHVVGVGELLEEPPLLGVLDDGLPLALVRIDERLHLLLELGRDAEAVVDDRRRAGTRSRPPCFSSQTDVRVSRSAVRM